MPPASWKTKILAVARLGRPYRLYLKASVRLRVVDKTIFQSDCRPIHAMMTLLYRTIETTLKYD